MRLYFYLIAAILQCQYCLSKEDTTSFFQIETALLKRINEYRTSNKIGQLYLDPGLQKSAQNQCDYLFKLGKLTHEQTDKKLKTTKQRIQFFALRTYSIFGENCLSTYTDLTNLSTKLINQIAGELFELWRKSKPHNENLLTQRFTNTGFGFCMNPETGKLYCVMNFGGN